MNARARLTIGALFAAALIISGTSAIAQPAPHQAAVHYNIYFPGINHWFAKDRPPPETPLLRFYMLEHTNSQPRSFRGLLCLHKFPRLHGEAKRVFPCARVTLADLAVPGDTVTWHIGEPPYSTWICSTGRFFVSFSTHIVSSSGLVEHKIRYSPYHKGSLVRPDGDWGSLPPDRREAHRQTSCKQVKGA